ncbi:TPA: hypothetical protein GFY00_22770 [Escherichia coli]|nr:hypothetical protein [Escherichia coli]
MKYKCVALCAVALMLTGCAQQNKNNAKPAYQTKNTVKQNITTNVANEDAVSVENSDATKQVSLSHITQCNRDLESMRTVDIKQYMHYQREYDELMKSSANFLTVKDDVSPEIASLARPRFQFALVNLCYRIKDALARTFIKQAGGGK